MSCEDRQYLSGAGVDHVAAGLRSGAGAAAPRGESGEVPASILPQAECSSQNRLDFVPVAINPSLVAWHLRIRSCSSHSLPFQPHLPSAPCPLRPQIIPHLSLLFPHPFWATCILRLQLIRPVPKELSHPMPPESSEPCSCPPSPHPHHRHHSCDPGLVPSALCVAVCGLASCPALLEQGQVGLPHMKP